MGVRDAGRSIGTVDRATLLNLALYLAHGARHAAHDLRGHDLRAAPHQPAARVRAGRAAGAGHQGRADRLPQPPILRRGDHREIQRHRRYGIPLSLLFIDINRFKAINDTLGHEEGDRVLQRVAAFLVRNVREADYVFRWGGDEFLILISCRAGGSRAQGAELKTVFVANRSCHAARRVGLSVGCAEVSADDH